MHDYRQAYENGYDDGFLDGYEAAKREYAKLVLEQKTSKPMPACDHCRMPVSDQWSVVDGRPYHEACYHSMERGTT